MKAGYYINDRAEGHAAYDAISGGAIVPGVMTV